LTLREKFHLRVTALNVTTTTYQYEFNTSITSLALKSLLHEALTVVRLPILSGADGATVDLEITACNVKIERAEV
jgi:hypothetical protein